MAFDLGELHLNAPCHIRPSNPTWYLPRVGSLRRIARMAMACCWRPRSVAPSFNDTTSVNLLMSVRWSTRRFTARSSMSLLALREVAVGASLDALKSNGGNFYCGRTLRSVTIAVSDVVVPENKPELTP